MFAPALALLTLTVCPAPAQAAPDTLPALCESFAGHDGDGDGRADLAALRWLAEAEPGGGGAAGDEARVLLLVEDRLLDADAPGPALQPRLRAWLEQSAAEGPPAAMVGVRFTADGEHRDGAKLLALRAFLKRVHDEHGLAGAVLVGRFPDALLVRTCNWRKGGGVTLHKGSDRERHWDGAWLRRVPEAVAHRCDIVLADLDGNWDELYVAPRVALPATIAAFPEGIPRNGGVAADLESSTRSFEDFFHVADGRLEAARTEDGRWHVSLHDRSGDLECTPAERGLPNALAQPEIFVSRLDAHGIALIPDPSVRDADGLALTGPDGRPQELRFASADAVPGWSSTIWKHDAALERRLLDDYFADNLAYRRGEAPIAFRPASIACDLGSGYARMRRAAPEWDGVHEAEADLRGKPTLVDLVGWLQRPAVLRTLRAHSDPWGSVFGKAPAERLDELFSETALGAPLSWTPRGERLVPSLAKAAGGGKLDFFLLRSLWQAELLPDHPSLWLHTGCHGISPPHAADRPFDDPAYGRKAGGESLLFFGRGLALVGRAKVFYDEPRGFAEELAAGRTVGHAWARYFAEESRSSWGQAGGDIGRKRSYFWSILGDWTLTLRRPADS